MPFWQPIASKILNVVLQKQPKHLSFWIEQLPELRQQLDVAEREFNTFRQQFNTVDVTKESELYLTQSISLETQKAQLEQQVAEASAKYTNEHPVMQQMNAQLGGDQ